MAPSVFATRPVPKASLGLLLHPERDAEYRHFEVVFADPSMPPQPASTAAPFDHAAAGHSPVNAWWLSEAALLSYWDPAGADVVFAERAGLRTRFIDVDSTQCYVAWNDSVAIVAFRGTEADQPLDLLTDINIVPVDWPQGGHVHLGFVSALDSVWTEVIAILQTTHARPWFTGHSLGGALATLAADRHGNPGGVYTFGSPRVGDDAFAQGFARRHPRRSFRYVNGEDAVAKVPWLFSHVEHETRLSAPEERTLLPDALIDHTPRRYATLVWNSLAAAVS